MTELSADLARALLSYDEATGILRWKVHRGPRARAGGIAGSLTNKGYLSVMIGGRGYLCHRLAWLIANGSWPFHQIDHKDRDRSNNILSNLREATSLQNHHNVPANGFFLDPTRLGKKKYIVRLNVNHKSVYVGIFETADEARSAYLKAHASFHGEFHFLSSHTSRANPAPVNATTPNHNSQSIMSAAESSAGVKRGSCRMSPPSLAAAAYSFVRAA